MPKEANWKCNVCGKVMINTQIIDSHVEKEYRKGYRTGPYMDHMNVVKYPNMTRREYQAKLNREKK